MSQQHERQSAEFGRDSNEAVRMIRITEIPRQKQLRRSVARLARVRPIDVVLASTRWYSSLPLVGKHLEPFAGLTALALWGGHYLLRQFVPRLLAAPG